MVKKYALKYDVSLDNNDGKGFTKEEILESRGSGGTDALVIISIIRGGNKAHEGHISVQIASSDGQNYKNPIPDTELFHVWNALCSRIIKSPDTSRWQKYIAQETIDRVRDFIKGNNKSMEITEHEKE